MVEIPVKGRDLTKKKNMAKLSEKRKTFCDEYIRNGFNAQKAYRVAYPGSADSTVRNESSRLLKNPRIQEELEAVEASYRVAGYKVGIYKDGIMRTLFNMMDAKKKAKDGSLEPDYTAINNAIVTYAKLTGDFTERKKLQINDVSEDQEFDPSKLTKEQIKELKEKILSEL